MSGIHTTKIALVGESDAGKTHQIRFLIEKYGAENVGIVSCEQGLGTIATLTHPDHVFNAHSYPDMRKAHVWASELYNSSDKWVVMDGASRVMRWMSDMENAGAAAAQMALIQGVTPRDMPAEIQPYLRYITDKRAIDTYAINKQGGPSAQRFWDAWLGLKCNLYASFWPEMQNDGQFGKKYPLVMDVPGELIRGVTYSSFDYVFHLVRQKEDDKLVNLCVTEQGHPKYKCRQRIDPGTGIVIPPLIRDFNIADFHDRIRRQVEAAQSTTTIAQETK